MTAQFVHHEPACAFLAGGYHTSLFLSSLAVVSFTPTMPVLSRLQQNDIIQIAEAAGLRSVDFDRRIEQQQYRGLTEVFLHRPTEGRFEIALAAEGKFWVTWWPAFQAGDPTAFPSSWNLVTQLAQRWSGEVKRNDDVPDLWAEAAKARRLTDAASDVDANNTPFDPGEVELLKPQLDEVEAYIALRQPLNEEQKRTLHARFQYLLGAAKRGLGRVDWLNIFVSQIVQLFTEGVLHSSLYGDVMRHAASALSSVLNIGARLLRS